MSFLDLIAGTFLAAVPGMHTYVNQMIKFYAELWGYFKELDLTLRDDLWFIHSTYNTCLQGH